MWLRDLREALRQPMSFWEWCKTLIALLFFVSFFGGLALVAVLGVYTLFFGYSG